MHLDFIREAIGRIEEYTRQGEAYFMVHHLEQDAVIYNLQTIAEASKDLPNNAKKAHPEISWNALIGFRNLVIHEYLKVDPAKVWRIVSDDLPLLKIAIASISKACESK